MLPGPDTSSVCHEAGLQEVCRKPGIQTGEGETWDGLTFCLNTCARFSGISW